MKIVFGDNGPATMRVRLIPLNVGPATLGPYDCVKFSFTAGRFDAVLPDGTLWQPLDTRIYYACYCEPIEHEAL